MKQRRGGTWEWRGGEEHGVERWRSSPLTAKTCTCKCNLPAIEKLDWRLRTGLFNGDFCKESKMLPLFLCGEATDLRRNGFAVHKKTRKLLNVQAPGQKERIRHKKKMEVFLRNLFLKRCERNPAPNPPNENTCSRTPPIIPLLSPSNQPSSPRVLPSPPLGKKKADLLCVAVSFLQPLATSVLLCRRFSSL